LFVGVGFFGFHRAGRMIVGVWLRASATNWGRGRGKREERGRGVKYERNWKVGSEWDGEGAGHGG
jgi:hypothetical protein